MVNISQYYDLAFPGQIDLIDAASRTALDITSLNETITFYLILILSLVIWLAFISYASFSHSQENLQSVNFITYWQRHMLNFVLRHRHETVLELIWTIVPAIILVLLAIPSFALLYLAEVDTSSQQPISVVGHQWYWEYIYPIITEKAININTFTDKSYHTITSVISADTLPRLLKTEKSFFIPSFAPVKFMITAEDVIHSFAIPAAGIKVDAVPGRLNAVGTLFERESIFHGACSELCGINHGFMPIVGTGINLRLYHILISNFI